MNAFFHKPPPERRDWLAETLRLVESVRPAGGGGAVRPGARLGADLGLGSLAAARLAGLLRKKCGGRPLPFHALFTPDASGAVRDITVADLAAFLERHGGGG